MRANSVSAHNVSSEEELSRKARQAVAVWILFFLATVTINLLIPLALGLDLRSWTYSNKKGLLLFAVDYVGFFLVLPLVLVKGLATVRRLCFVIPLAAAAMSRVLLSTSSKTEGTMLL